MKIKYYIGFEISFYLRQRGSNIVYVYHLYFFFFPLQLIISTTRNKQKRIIQRMNKYPLIQKIAFALPREIHQRSRRKFALGQASGRNVENVAAARDKSRGVNKVARERLANA